MKKQLIAILFSVCVILFWVTGVAAELIQDEFIEQVLKTLEPNDEKKARQLIEQNPNIAAQMLQELMIYLYKEAEKNYYAANYSNAIALWERGLELAQKLENQKCISQFMTSLGVVYDNLGQYEKALSYQNQALKVCQETKDLKNKGGALSNIGMVYSKLGEYEKALSFYEQALVIHREIRERQGEGNVLGNIGVVYDNLGAYDKALLYHEQALAIHREIRDRRGEGNDLTNIGIVYQHLGKYEKALSYYEQALAIHKEIRNHMGEGANLSNIGNVYQNLGAYEKSLSYYEQALAIHKEIKDRRGEGNDLSRIGVVYDNLGEYEKALSFHEQALAIHKEIKDRRGEGADLSNIGAVYQNLGQYDKALGYFQQALAIHREIKDRRGEGNDLSNIGLVYDNLGEYEKALSFHEQALSIDREIRDRRGEGNDLTNIGVVYWCLGAYEQALSFHEDALAIAREIKDRQGEGNNLTNIGNVYKNLGTYEKALLFHEQALEIKREIRDRRGEGNALTNIGVVYWCLGAYEKALLFHEQALAVHREIKDRRGEGNDLTNIGNVYSNLGAYEKALLFYEQALEIKREIRDRRGEGNALTNIGVVYWCLGAYEKALLFYEQALAIDREIGNRRGEGNVLSNIGLVYTELGQNKKATESLSKSAVILSEISVLETLWIAQRGLAKAKVELKQYNDAVKHYEESLKTIEKLRSQLTESETKISFMSGRLYVYDEFITLLQTLHDKYPKKGYDQKSFEIFERKQGRVFLEEMGKSGARLFADFPDTLRQKEANQITELKKIGEQLTEERSKPSEKRNTDRIRKLEQEIESVKSEQENLKKEIRDKHPDYYALRYPQPVKLVDLQKNVLKPGEAMLIYGVMKELTCLWVVSKTEFRLFPIHITEETLTEKVNLFREYSADRVLRGNKEGNLQWIFPNLTENSRKCAADLYQILIPKAVLPLIANTKLLYIIPTSALYGLPFEALSGDRYLIEDYPIAYLSSASLLKILRDSQERKKEKAKYPLLAFAHPVYGTKENPCFDTDSISPKGASAFSEIRTRGYLDLMGGKLCELKDTEDEVREIQAILNPPAISDPLQLREKASKSNLFDFNKNARLDDYQYVIFSCHGILPNEITQVRQPALALSHPDPKDKTSDGFFTMAEAFGIKLNADLVILSACNTGRGNQIKGEGIMGLTRAFMYAGTPAVSVTLWSVDSNASKTFSKGLFENLKAKKSRAEALRDIKLKMMRGEEGELFRHPFFWAPVVFFGDGE